MSLLKEEYKYRNRNFLTGQDRLRAERSSLHSHQLNRLNCLLVTLRWFLLKLQIRQELKKWLHKRNALTLMSYKMPCKLLQKAQRRKMCISKLPYSRQFLSWFLIKSSICCGLFVVDYAIVMIKGDFPTEHLNAGSWKTVISWLRMTSIWTPACLSSPQILLWVIREKSQKQMINFQTMKEKIKLLKTT